MYTPINSKMKYIEARSYEKLCDAVNSWLKYNPNYKMMSIHCDETGFLGRKKYATITYCDLEKMYDFKPSEGVRR